MNKELAQYINTLLAEKQREVISKQDYLDKIDLKKNSLIGWLRSRIIPSNKH